MSAQILVYCFAGFTLALLYYASYQLYVSLSFSQANKRRQLQAPEHPLHLTDDTSLPTVTFQIALFNEGQVVDHLFTSLLAIHYPKERIAVQLLDDSNDASVEINTAWVARLNEAGFRATHLRREHRNGFKAGALNEGLKKAEGEFIALFDADFSIPPNWLRQCLEAFENPSIAAVQSRWVYGNSDENLLTAIQTIGLNHHFINEHLFRDHRQLFTTFNGTAALWKKSVISELKGFSTQTLTEDLNLAYRAQFEGYQIAYHGYITASSELPAIPSAYFTQQFRWNKGAAENFRLLRHRIGKCCSSAVRFHALMHLFGSSFYVFSFLILMLGLSTLVIQFTHQQLEQLALLSSVLSISALLLAVALYRAARIAQPKSLRLKWLIHLLLYFTLSAGMSFMNTKAVLEGHLGIRSSFVRTPKMKQLKQQFKRRFSPFMLIEGLLATLAWMAFINDLQTACYSLIGLHLFTALAFSWVCVSSWKQP
ncbi:MAG: hypothetical protein RLZZ242_1467 [Bacteroidota bacterium]|jgi:cellulose synthase/poly-beta-1,6-N-acetylglucosamine synthase-like glycosyltransferase